MQLSLDLRDIPAEDRLDVWRSASATSFVPVELRDLRLHAAARELRRPSAEHRTIEAVARRCGFADAAYFSRLFTRAYGVSPRQWRARTPD
jgi:AraC-like DNA-binding protein